MPKLNKNSNKIWIYVGILVLIIIIAFIWLAYFQSNEAPDEPAQENDFKGPTAEEQEELFRRITGPGQSPSENTGSDSGGSNFEEDEVDEFFNQEPTPGFSQEEADSFFNE